MYSQVYSVWVKVTENTTISAKHKTPFKCSSAVLQQAGEEGDDKIRGG